MPPPVTKRVVRPTRSPACTRLPGGDDRPLEDVLVGVEVVRRLAAVEHDDAPAHALGGVLANLELLGSGRRLPVDRAWLVAVDVVAQGVELARPEALRLRHQVAAEHTVTERRHRELDRPRGDHHLGGPGPDAPRHGQPELVAPFDLEGSRA